MTALVLMLALQAPIEQEVDTLRARMREVELEVAIIRDRLEQEAVREADERDSELAVPDVLGMILAVSGLLGGGKYIYDRRTT